MANDKPWLFKPGQSGNPLGKAATPPDVREAKIHNKHEVTRIISEFFRMTRAQIQEEIVRPDAEYLRVVVGKMMLEAAKHGDPVRLNFLFDRSIGKVKEEAEVTLIRPFIVRSHDDKESITLGVKEVISEQQ